jgi:hypothetical protein
MQTKLVSGLFCAAAASLRQNISKIFGFYTVARESYRYELSIVSYNTMDPLRSVFCHRRRRSELPATARGSQIKSSTRSCASLEGPCLLQRLPHIDCRRAYPTIPCRVFGRPIRFHLPQSSNDLRLRMSAPGATMDVIRTTCACAGLGELVSLLGYIHDFR